MWKIRSRHSSNGPTASAQRIKGYLADGLDVFTYFNNDLGAYAVSNAADLRRYATES
jgi:uncharacterized protein YecE (DUF72 family)